MLTTHLKSTVKKIFVWFFVSCIIGYLAGAVIATVLFPPTYEIYIFGLILSLEYIVVGGPIFLIIITIYFLLDQKYKIDQSWFAIVGVTFLIALLNVVIVRIIMNLSTDRISQIITCIIFYSTWLGTILPRLLLKSLNPNKTA